ncbi:MAG: lipopolysaccharide core heptose(I) kinase RfaP [Gammaproteobacteria bacterium]|nr:lipopolysaccharide core heptose(I) kinase RfaP [Gammaproteobacteria bacterium]
MIFYLKSELAPYFNSAKPLFDQLMACEGELFRDQDGRRTKRIVLGQHTYFIKQHFGVGYKEIFKNILQGRLPILSAKNEWLALQKLQDLQISAPLVVGYGSRGFNPARLESFVLMKAIPDAISLEDLAKHWQERAPLFSAKRLLIKRIASIAAQMHNNGMNHRDFYLCHFLLPQRHDDLKTAPLFLIDLHRAGLRQQCTRRWIIKDLAGLYFSSKDLKLTLRDFFYFIKHYRHTNLRAVLRKEKDFWEEVQQRGDKLYRDHTV